MVFRKILLAGKYTEPEAVVLRVHQVLAEALDLTHERLHSFRWRVRVEYKVVDTPKAAAHLAVQADGAKWWVLYLHIDSQMQERIASVKRRSRQFASPSAR